MKIRGKPILKRKIEKTRLDLNQIHYQQNSPFKSSFCDTFSKDLVLVTEADAFDTLHISNLEQDALAWLTHHSASTSASSSNQGQHLR